MYKITRILIALVWLINGLICKVMHIVPRHQEIVSRILGPTHAKSFTLIIGLAEIGMAIWIISGIRPRFNAIIQILVVGVMNIIEYILVPDLLLWGKFNALFALLFIGLIYYAAFHLHQKKDQYR